MFTDVLMLHSNTNSVKMFSGLSPTWMTSQRLCSFSRTPMRLFNSKALHKRMYLYREGFYFSANTFTEDLKTTFNSAVASLNSHLRLSACSSNQLKTLSLHSAPASYLCICVSCVSLLWLWFVWVGSEKKGRERDRYVERQRGRHCPEISSHLILLSLHLRPQAPEIWSLSHFINLTDGLSP